MVQRSELAGHRFAPAFAADCRFGDTKIGTGYKELAPFWMYRSYRTVSEVPSSGKSIKISVRSMEHALL